MSAKSSTQFDLFDQAIYPVRHNPPTIDGEQFHSELARAVGRALDKSGADRFEIANRMAKALGQDEFSKAMLDAYASESKDTHNISLVRLIALIKATEQEWLMDFIAKRVGAIALIGDEAKLAEEARLAHQIKALQKQKRELGTPSPAKRRRTR